RSFAAWEAGERMKKALSGGAAGDPVPGRNTTRPGLLDRGREARRAPTRMGARMERSIALQGSSCISPGRHAAPGPAMSAAPPTRVLPVSGMQNTLASVAEAAGSLVAIAPAGEPTSVIVRAGPTPKAPEWRCLHFE